MLYFEIQQPHFYQRRVFLCLFVYVFFLLNKIHIICDNAMKHVVNTVYIWAAKTEP